MTRLIRGFGPILGSASYYLDIESRVAYIVTTVNGAVVEELA